ncbi:hypothetical protein [Sulfurisoma sediminicola]|uniref:Uncharacterized protein n=1 Tax=Sulfurisoma sediminicola TaxID=1381557 RepID=A0A497XBC9_9PROT|nr:hypothetical protein [Sulfurisoma sediminicola]RLJ63748.1 hypothetical protein DFR35_2380 [Sulfurisoma sediminicola]
MAARRLLFLDATSLTAYRWASGHLSPEAEFAPNAGGFEAFGEYVAKARRSLFYLLVDFAEEGFQVEEVPYVQGKDRTALIQRKLSQYFYGTPYAAAVSLGRRKDGRRDERMLFTALTRPPQIEPWLTVLRQAEGRLAGLFSVPMVLAGMPLLLGAPAQRYMVLSTTRAGVRQTLIDNGRVTFSRLTPLVTGTTEEMALTCAAEAERMYQYVTGQRLIGRADQMTTHVLVHPAQAAVFRENCIDTDTIHFQFIDLLDASSRLGLKTPPQSALAEALFLHVLAHKPPREQFAPAEDRHFFRLAQIRFGLRATGATIFTACLLFAGRHAIEYQAIGARNAETAAMTAVERGRYDAILQALPKIPLSNDALRALTGRYERILRQAHGPEPMYVAISQALQESPRVELTRLDWALGGRAGAATLQGTAPVAPGSGTVPSPTSPADLFESVELHAQLPLALATDPRAQRAAVDVFVEHLRARNLGVQVLKHSFEADSAKSIKSSGDGMAQVQAPQFSLRIGRRI